MKRRGSFNRVARYGFSEVVGLRSFGVAAQSHRKLEGLTAAIQGSGNTGIFHRLFGDDKRLIQETAADLQQVVAVCEQYLIPLRNAQKSLQQFKRINK